MCDHSTHLVTAQSEELPRARIQPIRLSVGAVSPDGVLCLELEHASAVPVVPPQTRFGRAATGALPLPLDRTPMRSA